MDEDSQDQQLQYDAPVLRSLGTVAQLTQGFLDDKRWGGTDGLHFAGINVPVHNASP
jgi:hypothetical protein